MRAGGPPPPPTTRPCREGDTEQRGINWGGEKVTAERQSDRGKQQRDRATGGKRGEGVGGWYNI
jgi:hypothetical protein